MARVAKKQRGVFERPKGSGVWWICYFDQFGGKHREKVGLRSMALNVYQQRKTEIRQGRFEPEEVKRKHQNATVGQIIDDFLVSCEARKIRTLEGCRQRLSWWREQLGERAAKSIGASDIEVARLKLSVSRLMAHGQKPKEGGRKAATVNRYLAGMKAAFSLAVRNSKADRNPVSMVRMQKENNCRVRWLTHEEEVRLFAVLPQEYHPLVLVALYTGTRRMELLKLAWADVNLQHRLITIRQSKSGESRVIPMHDMVYDTLRRLPRRIDSPYVFPGKLPGSHLTEIPHSWEQLLKKAGIVDFHWHDFRHTFASRLVMAGANLLEVKKLLGHHDLNMTERYAHLSPEYLKQTIQLLPIRGRTDTGTDTKADAENKVAG
jgi:integrase